MNCEAPSANYELLVSRNLIREKIRSALKLCVGRGCRYTAKELWQATGVTDTSLDKAMLAVDSPDYRALKLEELASLAKYLKAPFASAFLELSGLGAFELMDGQIPLPKVLQSAAAQEAVADERKRLIRRLAELEDVS